MNRDNRTYNVFVGPESVGSPAWLVVILLLGWVITGGLYAQSRKQTVDYQSRNQACEASKRQLEQEASSCQSDLERLRRKLEECQQTCGLCPETGVVEQSVRSGSIWRDVVLAGLGMLVGVFLSVLVGQVMALNAPAQK